MGPVARIHGRAAPRASTQAFAGASNADLKCQARGFAIEGNIPGDFAEFDLTVNKAGRTGRLASVLNQSNGQTEENAKITVVQELRDGVWTLSSARLGDDYGFLQMHALPKTVKMKPTSNGYRASFQAKASVNLPELSNETLDVTVACSLVHEI